MLSSLCVPDEILETNASKTSQEGTIQLAQSENLTVHQLPQRLDGYSGLAFVDTPETIPDEVEKWLEAGACNGFTVVLPLLPGGLDNVVDKLAAPFRSAEEKYL